MDSAQPGGATPSAPATSTGSGSSSGTSSAGRGIPGLQPSSSPASRLTQAPSGGVPAGGSKQAFGLATNELDGNTGGHTDNQTDGQTDGLTEGQDGDGAAEGAGEAAGGKQPADAIDQRLIDLVLGRYLSDDSGGDEAATPPQATPAKGAATSIADSYFPPLPDGLDAKSLEAIAKEFPDDKVAGVVGTMASYITEMKKTLAPALEAIEFLASQHITQHETREREQAQSFERSISTVLGDEAAASLYGANRPANQRTPLQKQAQAALRKLGEQLQAAARKVGAPIDDAAAMRHAHAVLSGGLPGGNAAKSDGAAGQSGGGVKAAAHGATHRRQVTMPPGGAPGVTRSRSAAMTPEQQKAAALSALKKHFS